MGLAVTAFEHATLLPEHVREEDCWEDHEFAHIIDPDFARSLRGLTADRCYEVSGKTASVSNSYSGHDLFREALAQTFLGVDPVKVWGDSERWVDAPFYELIHFADNEGTIGPEAATDLLADFEAGRDAFRDASDDDWLLRKYDEWAEVFHVAAGNGLVRFS